MAILAPLLAFLGRFVGKFLNMAFGWASVMVFGRVPQSKQLLVSAVALGSLVWVAVLVGVVVPALGTVLVAGLPKPGWIADSWIRSAMLILAIILPLAVGVAGLFLIAPEDRPKGLSIGAQILRGYPYAGVLAFVLLFLIVVAPVRKVRSLFKRWEDAHIPVMVKPGGYDQVADDVEAAIDRAGLPIERHAAPVVLELPSKLLAAVGGGSVKRLVPDKLLVLQNRQLEVTVHPTDVAISGDKLSVARSRAAIASTITFTAAHLTTSKEAQEVEDALREIADAGTADADFSPVDERIASLSVPHDEWEVLYRQRLQVERDLRRAAASGGGRDGKGGPLQVIGDAIQRLLN
ncbi:MAG: hypothetical protein DLM71_05200 [Chloroflexi bacterium]|nr:MAG: hypothetical protein DLM71_05200 [Chloroflexota bacterium]